MLRTNDDQLKNLRNPEIPDERTGIARPPRTSHALFAGWGPKLLTAAVTIAAAFCAGQPASAETKIVASVCAADHGAMLLSHPDVALPDGVYGSGETVLRVDLAASGQISNISIAQSSGDAALDFAAMRVARASRYLAASSNRQAAGDSFLFSLSDFRSVAQNHVPAPTLRGTAESGSSRCAIAQVVRRFSNVFKLFFGRSWDVESSQPCGVTCFETSEDTTMPRFIADWGPALLTAALTLFASRSARACRPRTQVPYAQAHRSHRAIAKARPAAVAFETTM